MKNNFFKYLFLLNVVVAFAGSTSFLSASQSDSIDTIKNLQAYQEVIDYIEQVKQMGLDEAELNELLEELANPLVAKNDNTNESRNKKILMYVVAAAGIGVCAWLAYRWLKPSDQHTNVIPDIRPGRMTPSNGYVLPQHDIERVNALIEHDLAIQRPFRDILNNVRREFPDIRFDFDFNDQDDSWRGEAHPSWNEGGAR